MMVLNSIENFDKRVQNKIGYERISESVVIHSVTMLIYLHIYIYYNLRVYDISPQQNQLGHVDIS